MINKKKIAVVIFLLSVFILLFFGLIRIFDFEDSNLSVIVENHEFTINTEKELLKGEEVSEEFIADNDNLGIISLKFNTNSRVNDGHVQFNIKESSANEWYYTNKYKIDQLQDNKYFPFGFPPIKDSKGKKYLIKIESLDGKDGSSVKVIQKSPFLSKYSFPKDFLLHNINKIPLYLIGKIKSFFFHLEYELYLAVLLSNLIFLYILIKIDINKILKLNKQLNLKLIKWINTVNLINKKYKVLTKIFIVICLSGLFLVNWFINEPIKIKALIFGDDLANLEIFYNSRDNFLGYVFNSNWNKFRPIFNIVFYILFYLFSNNTWLFGYFNLYLFFLISVILFYFLTKITKNAFVSFCLSSVFLISRFAYYNLAQALGVMESMSLLFSAIYLYLIWLYFNNKKNKYFWLSLIVFTLLIFTHERFIVLVGMYFIIFVLIGEKKNIIPYLITLLPVFVNVVVKSYILNIRTFDGTGGTNIIDTFKIDSFFELFFSGWLYLFGINKGPAYLNGIASENVPSNINIIIFIGIICFFVMLMGFVLNCLNKKSVKVKYINNIVLLISFISITLVGSSVTIRLEMRWLYVPFIGFLFLLAYILRIILRKRIFGVFYFFVFIVWGYISLQRDIFYRSYFKHIYFWNIQSAGNSLYESTIKKYGDSFWAYNTYILCSDDSSQYTLSCKDYGDIRSFFGQYNKDENKLNKVNLINKTSENIKKENQKILIYDRKEAKYIEISQSYLENFKL